eukprot:scaffold904_cov201-Alexandrium_tamarense.AAC.15
MPDKSSVFAAFQLNEGECMKNMCLLSLVSLAGEHEEIPYSAVASTLDIAEDQVEKWVILGVSSGLMEAKMDQLSKVVIVERCVVRQFGSTEWEALKVRLDKWKTNVRGVLDALKKSGAGVAIGKAVRGVLTFIPEQTDVLKTDDGRVLCVVRYASHGLLHLRHGMRRS